MIKLKDILKEMSGAMIDFAPTTDEFYVTHKISTFLDTLATDDDGDKYFENYIVKFKGFSDDGGLDVSHEGKTINQLEDELLEEWYKDIEQKHPNEKIELKEADWKGNVFYAIYILGGIGSLNEVNKSTQAVRRFYKRHPGRVRKYLKKTQDDRVARNRDRRRAIKKHGKTKMKKHDVHHPKGPHGGKTRLVKKDHGPDKKKKKRVNENFLADYFTVEKQIEILVPYIIFHIFYIHPIISMSVKKVIDWIENKWDSHKTKKAGEYVIKFFENHSVEELHDLLKKKHPTIFNRLMNIIREKNYESFDVNPSVTKDIYGITDKNDIKILEKIMIEIAKYHFKDND